jgi:glycosyltransferase involved in cell wall biosynthesis
MVDEVVVANDGSIDTTSLSQDTIKEPVRIFHRGV